MEIIDRIIPIIFIVFIGLILFLKGSVVIRQRWQLKKMQATMQKMLVQQSLRSAVPDTPFILDLRQCNEGMSCEEYSTLVIAGPYEKNLPQAVRNRMNQHVMACFYHQSKTWHNSALDTPVTETFEKAAMEIVKKYS